MSERVPCTRFKERTCPKCKGSIIPKLGKINDMHGHRLDCPNCNAFLGWGGKVFKEFKDTSVK